MYKDYYEAHDENFEVYKDLYTNEVELIDEDLINEIF